MTATAAAPPAGTTLALAIELRGISKRFGAVQANRDISLVVPAGTIHGIVGENGAGKSTLMNILYGFYQADSGQILVDGHERTIRTPQDAIKSGIGMVHQHFMLVEPFTVLENLLLGAEGGFTLRAGIKRARREIEALERDYGLEVPLDARVQDLPVGVQQRVEIIKALLRDAQVLVLDEPTAVLTPHETEDLFRIMRELREGGRSIIFISHKLKEVQAIADTITVIRRGKVVGERPPATSSTELASLMVGRSVQLRVSKEPAKPGDVVLDVQDLTVAGERGERSVRGVSFQVRAGEILGMAGVQGNGQTELCEALMGLRPSTGSVLLNGTDLSHSPTRVRLHAGIGYVPEDRSEDGLVADFSVADNLILDLYDQPPYASGIALNLDTIRESAVRQVEEYDVRTTSVETPAGTLSGGNQQKVVVAREMGRDVKLLLVSQPTRGLDVGSIEFVHKRLVAQRDAGAAVLIVSSELDEIYALADRIAVMYEGRIVAFRPPTISEQELGLLMAGSDPAGSTLPTGSTAPNSGGAPETPAPAQEPSSHE